MRFIAWLQVVRKLKILQHLLGMTTQQEEPKVIQSKWVLSQRSLDRLKGVHPDLVKSKGRAIEISEYDFMVVEGLRTKETQAEYVKKGVSQTMNSRHIIGQAVDLAPLENGAIDWNNKKGQFDAVAKACCRLQKS